MKEFNASKLLVLVALIVFLLAGVNAQDEVKSTWTQLDAVAIGLAVYMASLLVP